MDLTLLFILVILIRKLEENNNVILAFLSRSYHESVKNPNAFFLTQIGEGEKLIYQKNFFFTAGLKEYIRERILKNYYWIFI